MDTKLISDFYKQEAPAYAAADNIRKIASYIDGLKLSARKLVYTMFEKYPTGKIKTAQFANFCAAFTNYNQGENNLGGVASNMAQNFCGANNYPPLFGSGNFGNRLDPSPAATRYTFVSQGECLKLIFDETDRKLVPNQIYEGDVIEPKYFIPIVPYILLNGSDGISTGFRQVIYPRNLKDIVSYIRKRLDGVAHPRIDCLPWFRDFKGSVIRNKNGQIEIRGVIEKKNTNTFVITEIPVSIQYAKYCEFLDKLCDNGIIQTYEDLCDPKTNEIKFEIRTTREFAFKHQEMEDLIEIFHLSKVLNENLNCIDENNRVMEFNSIEEILEAFIKIRLDYYQKRKLHLLVSLKKEIETMISKYIWAKGIIEGSIFVSNVKKDKIIEQLERIDKVIKIDGSYNYLLNMSISSITKEKMDSLANEIKEKKNLFLKIKSTEIKDMWLEDLKKIEKNLN